jgi:uncharacterized protein (DUF1778 family)
MPTINEPPAKRQTLNLRIKAEERDPIDRAAHAAGKNRTEFIFDATRRAAEEVLLDRALLRVESNAFAAFQARLDALPQPNERLRKTMQGVSPREKP